MKRPLVAILAFVYFIISSGFTVNTHYCMGKKKAVKVQAFAGKLCACEPGEDNDCCRTDYEVVKLDTEHKLTDVSQAPGFTPAPMIITQNIIALSSAGPIYIAENNTPSPPLISPEIYLTNCVFRL